MTNTKTKAAKVDASKENAAKVQHILDGATTVDIGDAGSGEAIPADDFRFLCDFVLAVQKRLPSQKSIDKDRKRKRTAAKGKKQLRKPEKPAVVETAHGTFANTIDPHHRDMQVTGTETGRFQSAVPNMTEMPKE